MHSIFLPTLNLEIGVPGAAPRHECLIPSQRECLVAIFGEYVVEIDLRIITQHLAWIMVHIYTFAGIMYEVWDRTVTRMNKLIKF